MPLTQSPRSTKAQLGVGLIEILISLLMIAIGVLGLTTLQVNGLKNNRSSYYRTQATVLAYDIIDRMRANTTQASNGAYIIATGAASGSICTASCTPAQIATTDILEWKANMGSDLPSGDGAIATTPGTTNGYTISIQWTNHNSSATTLDVGVQL